MKLEVSEKDLTNHNGKIMLEVTLSESASVGDMREMTYYEIAGMACLERLITMRLAEAGAHWSDHPGSRSGWYGWMEAIDTEGQATLDRLYPESREAMSAGIPYMHA